MGEFDRESSRYKFCCKSVHVKAGAFVIGVLNSIELIGGTTQTSVGLGGSEGEGGVIAINVILLLMFIFEIFALICLSIGWIQEKKNFLIPFITVQIAQIAFLLIVAFAVIIAAAVSSAFIYDMMHAWFNTEVDPKKIEGVVKTTIITVAVVFAVAILIVVIIQIWFLTIMLGCFRYFRDKQLSDSGDICNPYNAPYPTQIVT